MTTHHRVVRVAAVQAAPAFLDREGTLERLDAWARRAAGEGAQLVAFPETWIPGYPAWLDDSPGSALWNHAGAKAVFQRLVENSVEGPGTAAERLAKLARELRVTLVVGVHELAGRTLYNTLLTFTAEGSLAQRHRNLMPTYHERMTPELPARPEKAGDPEALLYNGGSAVIAPNGRDLAGPGYDEEAVVVADCDLSEITREALTLDVSGHYSRPDVFRFAVRSEEHTSELQSLAYLVCRLLLEKKKQ